MSFCVIDTLVELPVTLSSVCFQDIVKQYGEEPELFSTVKTKFNLMKGELGNLSFHIFLVLSLEH